LQQTPELQTSTFLPANRALKASLLDLSRLLSPTIIRCGLVTQELQQTPESQTSTFLPECQDLKASLADLSRLLSPAILRCGPVTRNQPCSEGRAARSELHGVLCCSQSFACGGGCACLAVVWMLGQHERCSWADWARTLEKEMG
jgi:hypothetical protein